MFFFVFKASQFGISTSLFTTICFNGLAVASSQPVQSRYLPVLSFYYLFSLIFLITSFAWFVGENVIRSNKYMPRFVAQFCELLRRVFKISDFKWNKAYLKNTMKVVNESKPSLHTETDKTNEFEENVATLNRFIFACLLFAMFTVNLVIMVYLGS
jgi:hypothetical protein